MAIIKAVTQNQMLLEMFSLCFTEANSCMKNLCEKGADQFDRKLCYHYFTFSAS